MKKAIIIFLFLFGCERGQFESFDGPTENALEERTAAENVLGTASRQRVVLPRQNVSEVPEVDTCENYLGCEDPYRQFCIDGVCIDADISATATIFYNASVPIEMNFKGSMFDKRALLTTSRNTSTLELNFIDSDGLQINLALLDKVVPDEYHGNYISAYTYDRTGHNTGHVYAGLKNDGGNVIYVLLNFRIDKDIKMF